MAINYRVVGIIVPNRTPNAVTAALEIAPADPVKLEGLAFEGSALEVGTYGLSADMCGDPKSVKVLHKLTIPLDPFQEVSVRAIIETHDPPKGNAIAAFHVRDIRNRVNVGGVTIVCTTPKYPSDLPSAPAPKNPCPLVLEAGLSAVDPGADPSSATSPAVIDTTHPQDLVALVENPKRATLTNALMWLEHMDASSVLFEPKVWHLGTMDPKARFWATWGVDGRGASPGTWEATFVVSSDKYDPVRLRAGFKVLPRTDVDAPVSRDSGKRVKERIG